MSTKMLEKKRALKPGEMLRLSYDECFKIMFGDPSNIEILTFFISKLLGISYEELENHVTLLPLKTPNNTIGEKITERDIVAKAEVDKVKKIILEVNIDTEHKLSVSVIERNILYLDDVSSNGIISKDEYDNLPDTILINLNNFFVNTREKVIDEYMYRNQEGDILTTIHKIININIEKCYKLWYYKDYEGLSEKEKAIVISAAALWIEKKEEFSDCLKDLKTKPEIKKLMEKVVFNMCEDEELVRRFYRTEESDKKLREAIIRERRAEGLAEGRKEGLAEGLQEGITIGKEEAKREMVLKLYNNEVDINTIKKITDLELSEIEKIINDVKTK